jgi:hypothetical protein
MKLPMSERNSYILMIVGGVILGILLFFGIQNRSAISDWFAQLLKQEPKQEEEEESYPYFVEDVNNFSIGEESEWSFEIFQPEIVEYVWDEDTLLNYVVLKYSPDEDLSKEYEVRALLTLTDGSWLPESAGFGIGMDENDFTFERVVSDSLRVRKTFSIGSADADTNEELLSLSNFKSKFPVGSRIAMLIPAEYPIEGDRTESYCATFGGDDSSGDYTYICEYGTVLDKISVDLKDFMGQKETDSDFVLLPYAYSSEIMSTVDVETAIE